MKVDFHIIDVKVYGGNKNIFDIIDTDKDALISQEEFGVWLKKAKPIGRMKKLMKTDDKNGDGVLSWDEFSGTKGLFQPVPV